MVGVTLNEVFEHIVSVKFDIFGVGFTVTVTVNVLVQLFGDVPEEAVTLYKTLIAAFVILVNVWLIALTPVVWLLAPEIPDGFVTVHV